MTWRQNMQQRAQWYGDSHKLIYNCSITHTRLSIALRWLEKNDCQGPGLFWFWQKWLTLALFLHFGLHHFCFSSQLLWIPIWKTRQRARFLGGNKFWYRWILGSKAATGNAICSVLTNLNTIDLCKTITRIYKITNYMYCPKFLQCPNCPQT